MGEEDIEIKFASSNDSTKTITVPLEDIEFKDDWVIITTEINSKRSMGSSHPSTGRSSKEIEGESHGNTLTYRVPRERIYYMSQEIDGKNSEDGASLDSDRSGIDSI